MIREATIEDLHALAALECDSFSSYLLSRRLFRYLLTRGQALTLVETARPIGCVRASHRGGRQRGTVDG